MFYISHVSTYRNIGEIFWMAKSTAHDRITHMLDIVAKIAKKKIKMSENEKLFTLRSKFLEKGDFLGCVLAIDGTRVEIDFPSSNFDFYNRKKYFLPNFLCVVDFDKKFRRDSYSFGSSHDARIYRRI
ncbi:hypothetical protein CDIK_1984 [Cucumispora dikerogammari]|nr:hypothetical protein CDIK_1984 [Cucumispora dikerogammari]